jgi:hypothetical protein
MTLAASTPGAGVVLGTSEREQLIARLLINISLLSSSYQIVLDQLHSGNVVP